MTYITGHIFSRYPSVALARNYAIHIMNKVQILFRRRKMARKRVRRRRQAGASAATRTV